jgi:HAD superfamily hydrolase (TIGR01490 family)
MYLIIRMIEPSKESHSLCIRLMALESPIELPDYSSGDCGVDVVQWVAGAAFFDLDRTLWPCAGEKAFAYHLFASGGIRIKQLLKVLSLQIRYDLNLIDGSETLKRRILSELFSDQLVNPCLDAYRQFFAERLSKAFFPEMLKQIEQHRAAGDKIVIVSAAIDVVVAPVAEYLAADECYATTLETREGVFSGVVTGSIPFGKAKARIVEEYALRHGIELDQCHAYGDHWEDRHMLEVVGFPVAVNPERKLLRHARKKSWRTQTFRF